MYSCLQPCEQPCCIYGRLKHQSIGTLGSNPRGDFVMYNPATAALPSQGGTPAFSRCAKLSDQATSCLISLTFVPTHAFKSGKHIYIYIYSSVLKFVQLCTTQEPNNDIEGSAFDLHFTKRFIHPSHVLFLFRKSRRTNRQTLSLRNRSSLLTACVFFSNFTLSFQSPPLPRTFSSLPVELFMMRKTKPLVNWQAPQ